LRGLFWLADEIAGRNYWTSKQWEGPSTWKKLTIGDNPCSYIPVKQAKSWKLKGLEYPTSILLTDGIQLTIITLERGTIIT
jgi:hypothetical protein